MADPFLGQIILFGGNFAPQGWAFCDGQLLPIAQHPALFSILSTAYGGNGRTDFALPDLRGRTALGTGNFFTIGEEGGTEEVTLHGFNLPYHRHVVSEGSTIALAGQTGNANQPTPGPNRPFATPTVQGNPGIPLYSTQPPDTDLEGPRIEGNLQVGYTPAAAPQAHENMMPFLGLNYIIALVGVYPSR